MATDLLSPEDSGVDTMETNSDLSGEQTLTIESTHTLNNKMKQQSANKTHITEADKPGEKTIRSSEGSPDSPRNGARGGGVLTTERSNEICADKKTKMVLSGTAAHAIPNNDEPDIEDNTDTRAVAGSDPLDSDLESVDVSGGDTTKSSTLAGDTKVAWQEPGTADQGAAAATCARNTSNNEANQDDSSSGRLSQIPQSQSEAKPDDAPDDEAGSSHPARGSPSATVSATSATAANVQVLKMAVEAAPVDAASKGAATAFSTAMTPADATTAAEPLPSTSGGGSSNPAQRRQSQLTILPRTSQYERHALLQERTVSGLSEIQNFLLEKERGAVREKNSATPSVSASNVATVRPKLEPRAAQIESHALLERTSMGMCELELYLLELHREAQVSVPPQHSMDTGSPPQCRPSRLEPRVTQYEKNELLEKKEEGGLSAIARFLEQKEQEIDKGKCSAKFVCKNVNCTNCRTRTNTMEGDTSTFLEPKTCSKRVHFKQQSLEKDSETGEVEKASSRHRSKSLGDAMDNSKAKRKAWKLGSIKFSGHRPAGAKDCESESDNVAVSAGVKPSQPEPEPGDISESKTDMGKTSDSDKRACLIS